MNAAQVKGSQILKEWFHGQEAHSRGRAAQILKPRQTMFFVFDAHSPPDVGLACREVDFRFEQGLETLGTLCQHLIGVSVRRDHNASDSNNVVLWNIFVKEVAHGIHEDFLGCSPAQRLC